MHVQPPLSPPVPPPSDQDRLRQLLASLGLLSLDPANLLVVAAAGSQMYNLATPTSDTDYIIVYREPTEVGQFLSGSRSLNRFVFFFFCYRQYYLPVP